MRAALVLVADADTDDVGVLAARGGDPHWALARRDLAAVAAGDGAWVVRAMTLASGRDRAGGDAGLWEAMPMIADAAIVHVCRPHTRAGEAAVVATKLLGKPLVVSDVTIETSPIGKSFDLLALADAVVCTSSDDAAAVAADGRVAIVDFTGAGWPPELLALYGALAPDGEPGPTP